MNKSVRYWPTSSIPKWDKIQKHIFISYTNLWKLPKSMRHIRRPVFRHRERIYRWHRRKLGTLHTRKVPSNHQIDVGYQMFWVTVSLPKMLIRVAQTCEEMAKPESTRI